MIRICTILLLLFSCFGSLARGENMGKPPENPEALLSLLPLDPQGWKRSGAPELFGPENLWEYINGQAQMYLDYGFKAVATETYSSLDQPAFLTIEIYEMESSRHAFGIYAAERSPEDKAVRLGADRVEGSLGDHGLSFWKGSYYVRLTSYEDLWNKEDRFIDLGSLISAGIKGNTAEPEIFSLFPSENRVRGSERFIPKDFLGQTYLTGGYRVDYESGGERFQLFVVECPSPEEAAKAFAGYRAFLESDSGQVSAIESKENYQSFTAKGRKSIFVHGRFFGGIVDRDPDGGRPLMEGFIRNLSNR
jgi:hypothetical protein